MKKIGWVDSFKKDELNDILLQKDTILYKKYDEILRNAIEMHLGRPVDLEKDKLHAISVVNSFDTMYFVNDVKIGTMTKQWGYNNDDFAQDKMSFSIMFTPAT